MRRSSSGEKVYGPYPHGQRWRLVLVAGDGRRSLVSFETQQEAERFAAEACRQIESRTLRDAFDMFIGHLRSRGVRPGTERTYEFRITAMLELDERGTQPTWKLTSALAAELYAKRVALVKVDTHRGELAACRAFGEYGHKKGWFHPNPFRDVEPVGRKVRGKPQLRVDEAKRFLDTAIGEGSRAGLAAALTLCHGLRASECTDRLVRDVDDGGRILWIDHAKTAAGIRTLSIDPALQPMMSELVKGRLSTEPLWGHGLDRQWLYYHVVRICDAAGVPRVTPQGLRGLYATLRIEAGGSIYTVAREMGHANITVTREHYVDRNVEENANIRNVARLLTSHRDVSQHRSQDDESPTVDPATN